MLKSGWDIDPIISDFILGKIVHINDYKIKVSNVTFHIPFLTKLKKFVLWKCYWPDCHNCCNRQGRLPLTSGDMISIGKKMKYKKISNFIRDETLVSTWNENGPQNQLLTMTTINLKRKKNERINEDGTYIPCRFLDKDGSCVLYSNNPNVCRLYPFSTWLENEKDIIQVHATFQFTGDCPGFYTSKKIDKMIIILNKYSEIIYNYNMDSNSTIRNNFSCMSFH